MSTHRPMLQIDHAKIYSSAKKLNIRDLSPGSDHAIIFIKHGSVSVSGLDGPHIFSGNELYFSKSKDTVTIYSNNDQPYEICVILFSGKAADLISEELGTNVSVQIETYSEIPRQLEQICLLHSSMLTNDIFFACRMLWNALGFIALHSSFKSSEDAIPQHVRKIQKLFHEKPADSYSLDTLAAAVHVNKFKLIKDFKEYFHVPPMQYLFDLRMALAKELLTSTDLSIARIASQSGFSTSNYFIHAFKSSTGFSPTEFRRKLRS